MKRVVVTGMGIVSPIGNDVGEVLTSLMEAKSGIVTAPEFAEHGFRSQVYGAPKLDPFESPRPSHRKVHEQGNRVELYRHARGNQEFRT